MVSASDLFYLLDAIVFPNPSDIHKAVIVTESHHKGAKDINVEKAARGNVH